MNAPGVDALTDHDYRAVLAAAQAAGLEGEPRAPKTLREVWAQGALQSLAFSCDGAKTQDGTGFNKPDTNVGRYLGYYVASGGGLDDAAWRAAIRICAKYQMTQVGAMPEPDDADRELDARMAGDAALEAARERARSVSSVVSEAKRRAMNAKVSLTLVGDIKTARGQDEAYFLVAAPYNADAVDAWRDIPGRRWERGERCNRVPYRQARALNALLVRFYKGQDAMGPKGFFVVGE
jgi:hypothetical protein